MAVSTWFLVFSDGEGSVSICVVFTRVDAPFPALRKKKCSSSVMLDDLFSIMVT